MKTTNRNKLYGMAAFLVIGMIAISSMGMAYRGIGLTSEDRDAIDAAIDSGDYTTWKNAVIATLTEENFEELQQRRSEHEFGNETKIRERSGNREEISSVMEEAFESENYESFILAIDESGIERLPLCIDNINEENYDDYKTLYEAKESEEYTSDELKDLADELGLEYLCGLTSKTRGDKGPENGSRGKMGHMRGDVSGAVSGDVSDETTDTTETEE